MVGEGSHFQGKGGNLVKIPYTQYNAKWVKSIYGRGGTWATAQMQKNNVITMAREESKFRGKGENQNNDKGG